jgi:hypothetical protein
MRRFIPLLLILLTSFYCASALRISGTVTNQQREVLPFSSVSVKGTNITTAANREGVYFLDLNPGKYVLVFRHVGYEKKELEVILENRSITLNIVLNEQKAELKEVVVKAGAEDPAYAIIRKAIRKRKSYLEDQRTYECQVYSKGVMNLRDFPNKLLGREINFEDGDTSKRKMIYLSETVSKLSVEGKGKRKIEVLSTKVSGQKDGYGFAGARWLSFYENIIAISTTLNPRGFVSPIADNALSMYRYKYAGTYFEDNKQIHSIKVIPRRKYEPCFSGMIQIVDDAWCIHSLDLNLTKVAQMSFADTLRVQQLYQEKGKDFWVIQNQVVYPSFKILGFDVFGSFTNVYSGFNTSPGFDKKYFNDVFVRYVPGSNKKSLSYWDSIRPLSLSEEETRDYVRKDSLEKLREQPRYLDSLDSVRNKIKWQDILFNGKTFSRQSKNRSYGFKPLISSVSFYPGEGVVFDLPVEITQKITERKRYQLIPHVRYGLSSDQLYYWGTFRKYGGKKYLSVLSLSGGIRPFQFNPDNPVDPIVNSISALRNEDNFLKMYAANYARGSYTKGVGRGIILKIRAEYQERMPFDNTTDASWEKFNDKVYAPNYPNEILSEQFKRHEALMLTFGFSYRPKSRYVELPERTINIGSKWPLLSVQYTKGVNGLMGSDVDYDKWQTELKDNWNLRLFGNFDWKFRTGGFLNDRRVEVQDLHHFAGNRFSLSTDFMNVFQFPDYYIFSNQSANFYALFAEHHFNGLLTNKIPGFKQLNWFLVAGARGLWFDRTSYVEWNIGLENILKVLRVDMIYGSLNGKMVQPEFRLGTRIPLSDNDD